MPSRAEQHVRGLAIGVTIGLTAAAIGGLAGASTFTCVVVAVGSILPICASAFVWIEMRLERQARAAEDRIRNRSQEIEQQFKAKNFKEVLDLARLIDLDKERSEDTVLPRPVEAMVAKARQVLKAQEEAARKEAERRLLAEEAKRELEERLQQARERVRLEEEKRREKERVEEESRKDQEHLATLKSFTCSLSGGCWVTRGTGGSDLIRGMSIATYRASASVISAFRSFYPRVRFATDVAPQVEALRTTVSSELVAKAETNIDGKYALGSLPGGRYVVFASWASTTSAMYWIRQLDVDCSGSRTLNLHNENATEVLNTDLT